MSTHPNRIKLSWFSLGNSRSERSASILLFMIGLGSWTQINIGGYTAISEFALVLMLPFNIIRNQKLFHKDNINTALLLLFLWAVGALITDMYHRAQIAILIRGLIPSVGIMAALAGIYPLLKRNPDGLKWMLLGIFLSSIVSIFVFQAGADVGKEAVQSGSISATEAVLEYKLFWVSRLNQLLTLPVRGWFLQTPFLLSLSLVAFIALFGLSSGGRSAFAASALSLILLIIGKKSVRSMRIIKKHIGLMLLTLIFMAVIFKFVYKQAALSGWMGNEELAKYEMQTRNGDSFLNLLIAGRSEFFVAMIAAFDSPLIGHGSYAIDRNNYYLDFIQKYGSAEDQQTFFGDYLRNNVVLIPAHSQIAMFWCWHGLLALIFWLYFGYQMVITLFKRLDVWPPYFGFLAIILPSSLWAYFFSPLGRRTDVGMLLAVLLIVQAASKNYKKRIC